MAAGEWDPGAVLRRKAEWVCQQLDAAYGAVTWRSHGEPLGSLVLTILSQNTTDTNSERAYDNLRRQFPSWDAVREASAADVVGAIRCGGLAETKAARIQTALRGIYAKTGATRLDFLNTTPTEEARTYLRSFPGVGPKTAACVLMFSLGRPVLPVDTHVFRVSRRLGMFPRQLGEAKAHDALQDLLPDERVYPYHVHLIRHGRRVCVAGQPRCGMCALRGACDFYRDKATFERGETSGTPEAVEVV